MFFNLGIALLMPEPKIIVFIFIEERIRTNICEKDKECEIK